MWGPGPSSAPGIRDWPLRGCLVCTSSCYRGRDSGYDLSRYVHRQWLRSLLLADVEGTPGPEHAHLEVNLVPSE